VRPLIRPLPLLLLLAPLAAQTDPVTDGMTITASTRLAPGSYRITHPLTIAGDDVRVELDGVTLIGAGEDATPDTFTGTGLLLQGRHNVTIHGGRLRGFKVGLLAQECQELTITGCDVSDNYRQRLRSTPAREDTADWLWPHENDAAEWRTRYGAGICLEDCTGARLSNITGSRSQNGILLSRCSDCAVFDNDCSRNSGWGLALWRSSGNVIARNRFDYCVRGYSHGVYHRGQDSAGILVFEQCSDNVFAYNSATHGGDGFFLYAGHQTTRRTGTGGCNRNLLLGNDFSYAVANGIEATFSRGNAFIDNRLDGCDYGIWAGYSRDTTITDNHIADCLTAGIAIEHGGETVIARNVFQDNPRGVWLWWDEDEDLLASAYGQAQDCGSHGYVIQANRFDGDGTAVHLHDTAEVRLADNRYRAVERRLEVVGECSEVSVGAAVQIPPRRSPLDVPGTEDPFLPPGAPRGRHTMMIDEWGPIDPARLTLFPAHVTGTSTATLHLLGPPGPFVIANLTPGFSVSPRDGQLPATLTLTWLGTGPGACELSVRAGDARLRASGSFLKADWQERYFVWPDAGPQQPPADWPAVLVSPARLVQTTDALDHRWGSSAPATALPADHFAVVAQTNLSLPGGLYELRTVSDDGVRVWIDGQPALADWTWHPPRETTATVSLRPGPHGFRVEHFEIDGWAQLQLHLRRLPHAMPPPFPVRVIYLVPADQPRYLAYERAIPRVVAGVRAWYQERAGVTFEVLPLEVIRSSEPYATMWADWVPALERAVGGWWPHTATLVFAQGGGGVAVANLQGDHASFAIVGDWVLEPISGQPNPDGIPVSECPQPIYVTGGTPVGTVAHELGHAFGLHHPPPDPAAPCPSVMEAHWSYPEGGLRPHEVLILQHVPFTGGTYDPEAPTLDHATADTATPGEPFTLLGTGFAPGDQVELLDLTGTHTIPLDALTPTAITCTLPPNLTAGLLRIRRGPHHSNPLAINGAP
jgi:parallel beta-helix repeat protein